ncbi:hypothetical protein A6E01_20115 (plasmid) [Vibrio breoganii]|uniref:Uncharacterized protein n=1 Tax=Vibrio breoganii TaxID=553239 RepID=A0AAN0XZQ2_9VIBR|nr:hypothetical protein [Vibrio breoganii]ANO35521.1 hypothetical protein A6E01_20115 [Vibrio breoganii]
MQQNLIIGSQPEVFAKLILRNKPLPTPDIHKLTKAFVLDSICRSQHLPLLMDDSGRALVNINDSYFDGREAVQTKRVEEMEYYEARDLLEDTLLSEMNIFMSSAEEVNASRYAQLVAYDHFQLCVAQAAMSTITS